MANNKRFRNRKNFRLFLCEIDGMPEYSIREIMGNDYIDTPGFYKQEAKHYNNDIEDFMLQNMGSKEFNKLKDYWENHVKV